MWPRILLIVFALGPVDASANSIWPFAALYMQKAAFAALWPIAFGLTVEFFFVWKLFCLTPIRAMFADLAMNFASALFGTILISLIADLAFNVIGISLLDFGKELAFARAIILLANFASLCLLNTAIETSVLRWGFKLSITRRSFALLLLANCISVAASFVALWMHTGGKPWTNPASFV